MVNWHRSIILFICIKAWYQNEALILLIQIKLYTVGPPTSVLLRTSSKMHGCAKCTDHGGILKISVFHLCHTMQFMRASGKCRECEILRRSTLLWPRICATGTKSKILAKFISNYSDFHLTMWFMGTRAIILGLPNSARMWGEHWSRRAGCEGAYCNRVQVLNVNADYICCLMKIILSTCNVS